jgi:hypothetical protein
MKKLILLIVPVLILMVSCNNKSQSSDGPSGGTDTITPPVATTTPADTTSPGGGSLPAQVFIDVVGTPITGAIVSANQNGKLIDKATSDSKGMYTYTLLVKGQTYTYISNASGYKPDTMTAPYDGTTNSLPSIGMTGSK